MLGRCFKCNCKMFQLQLATAEVVPGNGPAHGPRAQPRGVLTNLQRYCSLNGSCLPAGRAAAVAVMCGALAVLARSALPRSGSVLPPLPLNCSCLPSTTGCHQLQLGPGCRVAPLLPWCNYTWHMDLRWSEVLDHRTTTCMGIAVQWSSISIHHKS